MIKTCPCSSRWNVKRFARARSASDKRRENRKRRAAHVEAVVVADALEARHPALRRVVPHEDVRHEQQDERLTRRVEGEELLRERLAELLRLVELQQEVRHEDDGKGAVGDEVRERLAVVLALLVLQVQRLLPERRLHLRVRQRRRAPEQLLEEQVVLERRHLPLNLLLLRAQGFSVSPGSLAGRKRSAMSPVRASGWDRERPGKRGRFSCPPPRLLMLEGEDRVPHLELALEKRREEDHAHGLGEGERVGDGRASVGRAKGQATKW